MVCTLTCALTCIQIYHVTLPCVYSNITSSPIYSNMTCNIANRIYELRYDTISHTNQNANLCPYPIVPTVMPTTAHIRFYMVRNHVDAINELYIRFYIVEII